MSLASTPTCTFVENPCDLPTLPSGTAWSGAGCTAGVQALHGVTCSAVCDTGSGYAGTSGTTEACANGAMSWSSSPSCGVGCDLPTLPTGAEWTGAGCSLGVQATHGTSSCASVCASGYTGSGGSTDSCVNGVAMVFMGRDKWVKSSNIPQTHPHPGGPGRGLHPGGLDPSLI